MTQQTEETLLSYIEELEKENEQLQEINRALCRDNKALKADLHAAESGKRIGFAEARKYLHELEQMKKAARQRDLEAEAPTTHQYYTTTLEEVAN